MPGPGRGIRLKTAESDVEKEVHDVAVMDDIILAFGAFLAGFLSTLFAVILDVVIEGDRLRTDEAALKVGVNNAGRFRAVSPL